MKNLKDNILEKLQISRNRPLKKPTQIPNRISRTDNNIFNRIYADLKDMANRLNIDPDSDALDKLETYINHHLPQSLRTKEKIWAYISITLGYDYMFDDSDMDNWDAGYLHQDWEDVDPVFELAYRAAYDAQYERNK